MYREKEGIVQTSVYTTIFYDFYEQKYFDTIYQKFIKEHVDCEFTINQHSGEDANRLSLVISGWRDCTQQELQAKANQEQTKSDMQERSDKATLNRIRLAHPDWF